MSKHASTLALAARIRALDPRRHACLSADLGACGGDLVTEALPLSVLDRLVGLVERQHAALVAAEAELARRGPADGAALAVVRGAMGGQQR